MDQRLPPDEFSLDFCIYQMIEREKTLEECLEQFPDDREALEPLLRLTGRLQSAKQLTAPADFRLALRARIEKLSEDHPQAASTRELSPVARPAPARSLWERIFPKEGKNHRELRAMKDSEILKGEKANGLVKTAPLKKSSGLRLPALPARHWVYAVGLALILLLLVANTTTGLARRALPGEALFPVKIAVEKVQLALSASEVDDASLHVKFARERFNELSQLAGRGDLAPVPEVVRLYEEELSASTSVIHAGRLPEEEKKRIAAIVVEELVRHENALNHTLEIWDRVPPGAGEDFVRAQEDIRHAIQTMKAAYAGLQEIYPDLPGLRQILPTFAAYDTPWAIHTPDPSETPNPTKPPAATTPRPDWSSKWPNWLPTAWPTPEADDWATWIPGNTWVPGYTPLPPEVQTLIPTILPSYLPPNLRDINPLDPTTWPGPEELPDVLDDLQQIPTYIEGSDPPVDEIPPEDWPPDMPDEEDFEDFEGFEEFEELLPGFGNP